MAAGIPAAEPQPLTLVPHGDAPAGERVLQGPHGVPKAMGRAARSSETLSRLSDGERNALREIARALGARFPFETAETGATPSEDAAAPAPHEDEAGPGQPALAAAGTAAEPAGPESHADRAVLGPAPMQAPGREEVAWLRQPARDSGNEGMAPGLHPAPAAGNGTAAPPTPEPGPRDEATSVGAAGPAGPAARWPVEVVPAPQQPRPEPVGSGPASDDLPGPPPTDAVGAAPATRPPGPAHLPSRQAGPGPAPLHVLAVPVRPVAGDRMLDQLPLAALVHRDERVLFANRAFLDLVGCESLAAFEVAGGLAGLFGGSPPLHGTEAGAGPMALATPNGPLDAEVSVTRVEWGEALATLILMRPERAAGTHARLGEAESARSAAERSLAEIRTALADAEQRLTEAGRARAEAERTGAEAAQGLADAQARSRTLEATLGDARARVRELEAVLDTATDGVAVVDGTGRILSLNRAAEALFGYDGREVVGDAITVLLAPESHMAALQYLDRLRSSGAARLLNDGARSWAGCGRGA
jgi:PAS domain-containing protein